MTTELVQETCTPCRGGIPPLTAAEAARYHVEAPDWALLNDSRQIERTFWFANFREALTIVQPVGDLAESEHHHPHDVTSKPPGIRLSGSDSTLIHSPPIAAAQRCSSARRDSSIIRSSS